MDSNHEQSTANLFLNKYFLPTPWLHQMSMPLAAALLKKTMQKIYNLFQDGVNIS